jgi:WD40 repeat protein
LLPDGRLVSGSRDKTIRLWDVTALREIVRLEVDTFVECLVAPTECHLVAGDSLGRLHWLDVVD